MRNIDYFKWIINPYIQDIRIANPNGRKIRMGRKSMKCVIFGKSDISFVNLTIPFCENDHRFCKYDIIFSFFTSFFASSNEASYLPDKKYKQLNKGGI